MRRPRCVRARRDPLGVGQARGDLLAAGLEHLEDRFVGERVQHRADDAEAHHLGAEVRPVDAEGLGDLGERSAALRGFLHGHGYCTRNSA